MAYYMRYIFTGQALPDLDTIEQMLKQVDSKYQIINRQAEPYASGDLFFSGEIYAELELNHPGDDLFEDEITELLEELDSTELDNPADKHIQTSIQDQLKKARLLLMAQVLFGDNALEDGIRLLNPLWDNLFERYEGLLYIDYEGYYDAQGMLLELIEE